MPPDLIMSQQCLLQRLHTKRSKNKVFSLCKKEEDQCGLPGHSCGMPGANRTAVQPMPKLKQQPLNYAFAREKAVTCNIVVLSRDHFFSVLLIPLCTFGQLFPLFLFQQPGISCTMPRYAGSTQQQKVCDCTCHSLRTVTVRCRALKVIAHVA